MFRYAQYAIEILPLYLFIGLAKCLSFENKVKLGGYWFGFIVARSKKLRNRILVNLKLVEDTFKVDDIEVFIKEVGVSVGKTLTELIFNKEFIESQHVIELHSAIPEYLLSSQKSKRPIILVSGHFGQWEAVRIILKNNGLECGAIYRRNKNPFFESLYLKSIKLGGEPIFPAGLSGTKRMIKHLKAGGILALLLDQAVSDGDEFLFFGLKAKTSMVIAELALKYNAIVVPCYGIREPCGNSINVIFEDPITFKDPRKIIQTLNDSLEERVRSSPTQWHWLHNRWKI